MYFISTVFSIGSSKPRKLSNVSCPEGSYLTLLEEPMTKISEPGIQKTHSLHSIGKIPYKGIDKDRARSLPKRNDPLYWHCKPPLQPPPSPQIDDYSYSKSTPLQSHFQEVYQRLKEQDVCECGLRTVCMRFSFIL